MRRGCHPSGMYFYSRPCGRGDNPHTRSQLQRPAYFYSRPCGRGDQSHTSSTRSRCYFYSRPCGRGDQCGHGSYAQHDRFLLTPLREGRQNAIAARRMDVRISTHAPAGGATKRDFVVRADDLQISTHAPAGGATSPPPVSTRRRFYFYSRPCGRGDVPEFALRVFCFYFYSRPCGRGDWKPSRSLCNP